MSLRVTFRNNDRLIGKFLEPHKDCPSVSWKRTFYETRDDVRKVLDVRPSVSAKKWWLLLDFTRSCDLWREQVLLGAPVFAID